MSHNGRIGCYLLMFVIGGVLLVLIVLASFSNTETWSIQSVPQASPTSSLKWGPGKNLTPTVACDPSSIYICIPVKHH
jgi:hypothetical protein